MSKSLKLTESGDLDITSGNISFVEDIENVKQSVFMNLRTFRGEWFLNIENGIPYVQEVLANKTIDYTVIEKIIKDSLLRIEGVEDVINFEISKVDKGASVNFEIITNNLGTIEYKDVLL